MTKNAHQANLFMRNAMQGISNRTEDKFLSILEDRIYTLGQYIQQRHGKESYRELLNAVCSDRRYEEENRH